MINLQTAPFLREQRKFPTEDVRLLSDQVDHAYIDIAGKVNRRIIGLFALNYSVITGERWFFQGSNQLQQSLRKLFTFTAAGNIPHGLDWAGVSQISLRSYGSYTDGTNWYGVIYASSVPIAGQVSFYVTPTNIVVLIGAGAPAITTGTIDLEFISNF